MNTFWFRKKDKKPILKKIISSISYSYIFLLMLFFSFFSFINDISKVFSANWTINFSYIKENLSDIAINFWRIDPELSRFILSIDSIISSYEKWQDFLNIKKADIVNAINYISQNWTRINTLTDNNYNYFVDFVSELWNHYNDIFNLLWVNWEKKYIIALQNSNEARPNWWFFWSFILLTISQSKISYEIIDSYYVNHISPDALVAMPERRRNILWSENIWFVSSNVLWFTNIDWDNIISIYEKAFPDDNIDWIVFLQSAMIETLLPWFDKIIWEWQFVNANTDIIRWANLPWKKDIYKDQLNDFIIDNKTLLIKNFLSNFEFVLNSWYVQIYLKDMSYKFNKFLSDNNLITYFIEDKWYFWDFNYSYNKIDWFVNKSILLYSWWNIIENIMYDEFNFWELDYWKYKIVIWYDINVPSYYENYIFKLEEEYWIQMTEREVHILNMTYLFENMWLIYLPKNIELLSYYWDAYNIEFINDDNLEYNILLYWIKSKSNNIHNNLELLINLTR